RRQRCPGVVVERPQATTDQQTFGRSVRLADRETLVQGTQVEVAAVDAVRVEADLSGKTAAVTQVKITARIGKHQAKVQRGSRHGRLVVGGRQVAGDTHEVAGQTQPRRRGAAAGRQFEAGAVIKTTFQIIEQAAHEVRLSFPVTQCSDTGLAAAVDAYAARAALPGADVDTRAGAKQPRLEITRLQSFLTGEQQFAADAIHPQGTPRQVQAFVGQRRPHGVARLEPLATETDAEIHAEGQLAVPPPVVQDIADAPAQRRITQEVQPGAKGRGRRNVEIQQRAPFRSTLNVAAYR